VTAHDVSVRRPASPADSPYLSAGFWRPLRKVDPRPTLAVLDALERLRLDSWRSVDPTEPAYEFALLLEPGIAHAPTPSREDVRVVADYLDELLARHDVLHDRARLTVAYALDLVRDAGARPIFGVCRGRLSRVVLDAALNPTTIAYAAGDGCGRVFLSSQRRALYCARCSNRSPWLRKKAQLEARENAAGRLQYWSHDDIYLYVGPCSKCGQQFEARRRGTRTCPSCGHRAANP
jgi:hypothetical protein